MLDSKPYTYISDTFTGTGNGTSVDATNNPFQSFGMQVIGTGATPTLWTLVLEGSVDGSNFTTILTHSTSLGISVNLWTGTSLTPCRYVRSRVISLTLGTATNIVVHWVGLQ